jgi:ADP-heptose:LPS heptosyltransferase
MRVLALSPGPVQDQLDRLPALAAVAEELGAMVQVACDPTCRAAWELLPGFEKLIPFSFESNPSLADWTNLLGCVREPDFQACLNFADGQSVNLMLSMSHIPTRVALSGFASTVRITLEQGWAAQRVAPFVEALGCSLKADDFRLTLPSQALENARAELPSGDGPLLLMAPSGVSNDWPNQRWSTLPETIRSRLKTLRSQSLPPGLKLAQRAAAVACADVVLSSCRLTQLLAVYSNVPLVALGGPASDLPERAEIRCLGGDGPLEAIGEDEVLTALGF